MAIPRFPQRKDSDLLAWSRGFGERINLTPGDFGLTAAQASAYAVLHDAFAAAYALATDPNSNSKANINAKNQARLALLNADGGAWALVKIIEAHPSTTLGMLGELGLRVPREAAAVARPSAAPAMSIVATMGRIVKVRLRDREHAEKRGKPVGVRGATVLYWVGDEPPCDVSQWMFAMNASKPAFDVAMPKSVPAGSGVWLTAFWFNDKMEAGPAATAKQVYIGESLALAA